MATVAGSLRNKVLVLDDVTTGDLTVTGNISISGSATTLNSTNTSINDHLIELNAGLTGANPNDIGLILERGSSGNNVFIGWDESADKVVLALTTGDGTSTGNLSLTYADVKAGDITASRFVQEGSVSNPLYAANFSRSSSGLATPDIWGGSGTLVLGTSSSDERLALSTAGVLIYGRALVRQAAADQNTSADSTSIPSTTQAEVMRFEGTYTNGTYTTEFSKVDRSGNLPLYVRQSKGTANSFSNIARFGDHGQTDGGDVFAVFGGAKVTGTISTGSHGTSSQWNTAHGWGNHASAGYLTSVPNHSAALLTSGTIPDARLPNDISSNVTGSAGTLLREDNRIISSSELTPGRMKFGFTSWNNNNTAPYADFIHLNGYTDSSGGNDNLLMFNKNGKGMRVWQSSYNSSSAYSSYSNVMLDRNNLGTITGNSSQDFNSYSDTGTAYVTNWSNGSGTANGPSHEGNAYGWGMLRVTQFIDSNYVVQEYIPHNDDGPFIRVRWNGSWGPWRQTWSSRSDGANSGLDADKLDGNHGSHYLNYNNLTNKPTIPNGSDYLPLAGGTLTGTLNVSATTNARDIKISAGYHLQRSDHHSGHLEGSYNNVGANSTNSNPIYTIGSSYNPTSTGLGNMYGIGFCKTSASFITGDLDAGGSNTWGMYVAADGDARIFLSGGDGTISTTGEHYADGNRVFHDAYHPNADKWTTARSHTVTLTGEVTGTASQTVDGTGNKTWSIGTTINDSALNNQYVQILPRHNADGDSLVVQSKASITIWDVSGASDAPSSASDGLVLSAGWDSSSWGIQQYHDFHSNDLYLRAKNNGSMTSWDRVFHDTYHPNADKWTTARTNTVTLTGDVTGSGNASVDGTGNWTVSVPAVVVDNSHNHSNYVLKAGDTMTGALVVDVDNVANGALRIAANQTNPAQDFYFAQEIVSTLSGSGATGGDREQGGIHIDLNSSATGGDTSNEHRVYGIYTDVDSTGDADVVTAGYFNATATPTTGTTTQIAGVEGYAEDNGGAGATTNVIGVKGTAWSDNSNSDANVLYGGVFKASNSADSGAIGGARGVQGEIELTTSSGDIYANSYVFDAQYDNNTGAAPTHTAALYYGNYAGTLPTTALGVYIVDAVPNSFAGSIRTGLGSTSLTSYGFIGDTNTGMYSPANHQLGFTVNGSRKFYMSNTTAFFQNLSSGVDIGGALTVGGNITVSGTVDGRDIATDGAKLDGIAANATANTGDITGVTAGTGLTGGGSSGGVTLNVIGGTGITANANDIAVDSTVLRTSNYGTTLHPVYAPVKKGNVTLTNSYQTVATVNGSGLASTVRMTINGTGPSTVIATILDIIVNHSLDILVTSQTSSYTELTVKIISNNNEDFAIQIKTNSANNLPVAMELFALNSEAIAFTSTNPYSGASMEHVCKNGGFASSSSGGAAHEFYSNGTKLIAANDNQALHDTDALSISGNVITLKKGNNTTETVTIPAQGDITAVTAGNGLTGGGSSGGVTLNVGAGDGISVLSNTVTVDSTVIRTTGNQSISGVKTHSSRLALSAGQMLSLGDTNHHLVKVSTGYSGFTVDGPRLQGHQGGELVTNINSNQYSLRWDYSGNVYVRNHITANGYIGAARIYSAVDRSTGYFYNDTSTRTAYTGGDFYIKADTNNTYLYSTNTYLGNSSGDTIRFRTNTVTATNWGITSAGAVTAKNYHLDGTTGKYYGDSTTYYMNPEEQSVYKGGTTTSQASRRGLSFYHSSGPQSTIWYSTSTGQGSIKIYSNSTNVGDMFKLDANTANLDIKGNITAYSTATTSDARLKENVRDLEGSLDKTLKLRGVKFDWIAENKANDQVGFIAQEVEEVLPEVVIDHIDIDDNDVKVVNYQAVVPVLVEAIKELKAEIDELREQLKNK